MNHLPDPRKAEAAPADAGAQQNVDAIGGEPDPAAAEDAFWELDDVLAHEEISRSLRNMLGDC